MGRQTHVFAWGDLSGPPCIGWASREWNTRAGVREIGHNTYHNYRLDYGTNQVSSGT